jgi:hypothetical protein
LLDQIHTRSTAAGKRLLDVFTLHFYPQGGEALNDDISSATQLLRNRSTRDLWDTNYTDTSWIGSTVMLIPRMKQWVAAHYPGTKIGITEYNWGADDFANGATVQADVLGIFGREGLDLATRWTVPNTGTPAYNAFKMFRNYDGNKSVFGDVNIRATVPNPDNLAAFASVRSSDGKLTLLVINKDLQNFTPAKFSLTNVPPAGTVQTWQLNSNNVIVHLPDTNFTGGILSQTLPPQSVTVFVLPATAVTNAIPTLQVGSNTGLGQMELWLNGQAGRTYVLQSSTDLLNWSPISTNTLASNSFRFLMSATNPSQLFYRGWLSQP